MNYTEYTVAFLKEIQEKGNSKKLFSVYLLTLMFTMQ